MNGGNQVEGLSVNQNMIENGNGSNKLGYEILMQEYSDSNYNFRFLEKEDYNKDYFNLLSLLTVANKPNFEDWENRLFELEKSTLIHVIVIEYLPQKKIIGTITCAIELKFIRNLGKICHVEDFVIDKDHQRKKLGSKLLDISREFSQNLGCYKVLLDAKDELIPFYQKMGFKKNSNGMAIYF